MLVALRYDNEARHLDVIFRTGDKYRYFGVPPLEYTGLMSAKSKGQYMHKRILGDRHIRAARVKATVTSPGGLSESNCYKSERLE
jgi:hypothetical protein